MGAEIIQYNGKTGGKTFLDKRRKQEEMEEEEEEEEEGFQVVREPLQVRRVSSTVENVCPTQ